MRMKPDWLNDNSAALVEAVAVRQLSTPHHGTAHYWSRCVAGTDRDAATISGEKNVSRIRQSVVPIVTTHAKWGLSKSGSRKTMGICPLNTRYDNGVSVCSLSKGKPCTWRRGTVSQF